MSSIIGRVIKGRYKVESAIGRGGMSEVFKVWDTERASYLALKLLLEDLALDPVFVRRFRREGQTLAQLQHPNIVRFYGLEQDDILAFILMDYVDGNNLKVEIFQNQKIGLALHRIVEVMRPVCSALHFAHNQGLVHCDMKPSNIMIDKNQEVLVTDFGVSRLTEATTATMVGIGTPAYMSPEQIRGENPTPQTDIYALGIVLYEMLTGGERPFIGDHSQITGNTSEKVRWEQQNLDPPTLRQYNPNIPLELDAMVMKCLEKDPQKRYGSTLKLLNTLELAILAATDGDTGSLSETLEKKPSSISDIREISDSIASQPDKPTPSPEIIPPTTLDEPPSTQSDGKPIIPSPISETSDGARGGKQAIISKIEPIIKKQRKRGIVTMLLLLATITSCGVILLAGPFFEIGQPSPTPDYTYVAFQTFQAQPKTNTPTPTSTLTKTTTLTPGITISPTFSPTSTKTPFFEHEAAGDWPNQIAFASDRGGDVQIWLINSDGSGDPQKITSMPGGACQPSWSPDGNRIIFTSPCDKNRETYTGSSLHIINIDSDDVEHLPILSSGDYDPSWSPDGGYIAYTSMRENRAQIYLVNLLDNTSELISNELSQNMQPSWSPDGQEVVYSSTRRSPNQLVSQHIDNHNSDVLVTENLEMFYSHPVWSPDGNIILFTQQSIKAGDNPGLAFVPYQNPKDEQVVAPTNLDPMRDPTFAPDGYFVAFESWPDGSNHDIWIMSVTGGGLKRITTDLANDFDPAWRPAP